MPKLPFFRKSPRGSLQTALGWRIGLLLVLAVGSALGAVAWLLDQAGDRVQDEFLRRQAAELVDGLVAIEGRPLQLRLSNEDLAIYTERRDGYMFVIEDSQGKILLESTPMARAYMAPAIGSHPTRPTMLDTTTRDGRSDALYMLTRPVETPRGTFYLTVAQNRTIDDYLMDTAGRDIFRSLLTVLVPMGLVALALGFMALRQGLQPLYRLSGKVKNLNALQGETLPLDTIPREIRPLAESFNGLLMQLTRTLEAQKGLTADTAHQLKTPLAVLQARLEQLPAFEGKELLQSDVARMSRLVRQLLHYAVLSQHNANLTATNLTELSRHVVGSLVPLARKARVDLSFEGPEKPLWANIDTSLLTEAISNLVDNAIRHSPAPSGKGKLAMVEVVTLATKEGPVVEVRDRGPGIPASEQALVFTRFWQGPDVPTAGHHGGAGLGLALVAEIMRQHGGKASVHPREGGGSIFRLTLKAT